MTNEILDLQKMEVVPLLEVESTEVFGGVSIANNGPIIFTYKQMLTAGEYISEGVNDALRVVGGARALQWLFDL